MERLRRPYRSGWNDLLFTKLDGAGLASGLLTLASKGLLSLF
jgi:hypothetical protein